MPRPKPRFATIHEVRITREGDAAVIEFVDGVTPTAHLTPSGELHRMTDDEVLEAYNRTVRARQEAADSYVHVAVEVPDGKPQIAFHKPSNSWSARGGVLRCEISDDENLDPVITIDDRELTWDEFGKLVRAYAGWGMRVIFVPDDELTADPIIEVRDPED